MFAIFALALMLGNPYSVIYGKDYGGFRCGLAGAGVPDASLPKIFYPQLSADLAQQHDLINTPWKVYAHHASPRVCSHTPDAQPRSIRARTRSPIATRLVGSRRSTYTASA
jgi:hypothetical protein